MTSPTEIEERLHLLAAKLRVRARQARLLADDPDLLDRQLLEAMAANFEADAAEAMRLADGVAGAARLDAPAGAAAARRAASDGPPEG
jgi:hypothetical protein